MKWRAMRVQLQDSGDLLLGNFLRQFNFHFWDVYAANCLPSVFFFTFKETHGGRFQLKDAAKMATSKYN